MGVLYIMLGQLVERFYVLLIIPVLTAMLSKESFGRVSLYYTICGFLIFFVLNGFNSALFRQVTVNKDRANIREYEAAYFLFSLTAVFFIAAFMALINFAFNLNYNLFIFVFLAVSVTSLINYRTTFWMAAADYKTYFWFNFCKTLVLLSLFFSPVFYALNMYLRPAIELVVSSIVCLSFFLVYKNIYNFKLSVERIKKIALSDISYSWGAQVAGLLFWGLSSSDRLLISYMTSLESLALYTVFQIPAASIFIVTAFNTVYSRWYNLNRSTIDDDKYIRSVIYMLYACCFLLLILKLLIYVFSPEIISLVSNDSYNEVADILHYSVDFILFYFAYLIFTRSYHFKGKASIVLKMSILALIINIIFNVVAIPLFGWLGAYFATVLTHFLLSLIACLVPVKLGGDKLGFLPAMHLIVCLFIMVSFNVYTEVF